MRCRSFAGSWCAFPMMGRPLGPGGRCAGFLRDASLQKTRAKKAVKISRKAIGEGQGRGSGAAGMGPSSADSSFICLIESLRQRPKGLCSRRIVRLKPTTRGRPWVMKPKGPNHVQQSYSAEQGKAPEEVVGVDRTMAQGSEGSDPRSESSPRVRHTSRAAARGAPRFSESEMS